MALGVPERNESVIVGRWGGGFGGTGRTDPVDIGR